MSRQICLPINQVRLTNVAVVRMNRGGKRFEIAAYRNKVVNYRQGLETDLSEVLQTDRVFTNVSKGQFANQHDLEDVFGTRDETLICQTILDKGVLQVSDLERSEKLENTAREIATTVANTCVHPTSQRPYTVPQIREAMRTAEFAVHPTRTVKRQYLDCVKLLQAKNILPIERAKMKLMLIYPLEQTPSVDSAIHTLHNVVPLERSSTDKESQLVVLVDPSLYRDLDAIAKNVNGRLEILMQVVRQEGDVNLEEEMERKERKMEANEAAATLAIQMAQSLRIDEKANDDGVDNRRTQQIHMNDVITGDDDNDNDVDGDIATHSLNSRQQQKKSQKKSKKSKRREKEEAMERQARMEVERQRHLERTAQQTTVTSPASYDDDSSTNALKSSSSSCNTCGGSFPTCTQYRAHFRSDWHRYNIKLKMKGIAPVSEEEFVLCDSNAFF